MSLLHRSCVGALALVLSLPACKDAIGQSGWHQHPGPVFILVKSGTMTCYEANDRHCRPIVRTAGQGYLDEGTGHIARNETTTPSENIVVYLAPQAAALRIDIPNRSGELSFLTRRTGTEGPFRRTSA